MIKAKVNAQKAVDTVFTKAEKIVFNVQNTVSNVPMIRVALNAPLDILDHTVKTDVHKAVRIKCVINY